MSWTNDTPSVFIRFFKILWSLSNVFCDNVLAVEYASSSQRDNYPSPRLSELDIIAFKDIFKLCHFLAHPCTTFAINFKC